MSGSKRVNVHIHCGVSLCAYLLFAVNWLGDYQGCQQNAAPSYFSIVWIVVAYVYFAFAGFLSFFVTLFCCPVLSSSAFA